MILEDNRSLTVLTYHRICDDTGDFKYHHGVVSGTQDQFSSQMSYLAKHSNVISIRDVLDVCTGKLQPKSHSIMITFDDGYLDNYTSALPILLANGLTAAFFITTGFVEQSLSPWYDDLAYAINSMQASEIVVPGIGELSLTSSGKRTQAVTSIISFLKSNPGIDPNRFVDALRADGDTANDTRARLFMNWDEITDLANQGMYVAPHTVTHQNLTALDDRLVREEIGTATEAISMRVGYRPEAFAYPYGTRDSYNDSTKRILHDQGMRLAFTTTFGLNQLNRDADLLGLKRCNVDSRIGLVKFTFLLNRYVVRLGESYGARQRHCAGA
jgi:peptidoglycan/xylan/chitin deacetylase (PgdA/CDA1 family)